MRICESTGQHFDITAPTVIGRMIAIKKRKPTKCSCLYFGGIFIFFGYEADLFRFKEGGALEKLPRRSDTQIQLK